MSNTHDTQSNQLDFEDDEYDESFDNTDLIDQSLLQAPLNDKQAAANTQRNAPPRVTPNNAPPITPTHAPWTLAFYQPYFNVTTQQVLTRITRAFLGPVKWDFFAVLKCEMDSNTALELDVDATESVPTSHADLWGPFWITFASAVTLIIASNTIDLMNYASLDNAKETWTNDFTTVTLALGTIYSYLLIMATLFWTLCKFLEVKLGLLDTMCLYGYGYAVTVPFYMLCVVFSGFAFSGVDVVRWICVALAFIWSALFICANSGMKLHRELQGTWRIYIAPIVGVLFAAHICMGLFVKLYFLGGLW